MLIREQNFHLKNQNCVILRSPQQEEAQLVLGYLKMFFRESYRNMMYPASHWDNFPVEKEIKI